MCTCGVFSPCKSRCCQKSQCVGNHILTSSHYTSRGRSYLILDLPDIAHCTFPIRPQSSAGQTRNHWGCGGCNYFGSGYVETTGGPNRSSNQKEYLQWACASRLVSRRSLPLRTQLSPLLVYNLPAYHSPRMIHTPLGPGSNRGRHNPKIRKYHSEDMLLVRFLHTLNYN